MSDKTKLLAGWEPVHLSYSSTLPDLEITFTFHYFEMLHLFLIVSILGMLSDASGSKEVMGKQRSVCA